MGAALASLEPSRRLIEECEIGAPARVTLVGGELKQTRRLAVVLRKAAAAVSIEDPEISAPARVALIGGELRRCPKTIASFRETSARCCSSILDGMSLGSC